MIVNWGWFTNILSEITYLERVSRNNPRFGSGTLGNMTKVYNKKSTENSTKLIKAARYATGASIALQIIDTGKKLLY